MTNARAELGTVGEEAARRAYVARGYVVAARNWRCRLGEIDLVVRRGGVLVVCEVKTRRGDGFGGPFDAVTAKKQRRLRALAAAYLQSPGTGFGRDELDVRFDVASVIVDGRGRPSVHLFEDAF